MAVELHKAVLILFTFLSLAGCSSENGAVEKRNRFDACVLDFMSRFDNQMAYSGRSDITLREAGEIECRELLK